MENYIGQNYLDSIVSIKGNQTQDTLKKAYERSHFAILPSESEGWPKAIAEGMFWGCVPVATKVSCVPFMLDNGDRGILIALNLEKDLHQLETLLKDEIFYQEMSQKASNWSRNYTLDVFDKEIKKMVTS